jgi:hypothetical protein
MTTHYDADFYAWTQAQADALRTKQCNAPDLDHLAEEIQELGNEQEHAVVSHLRNLTLHLLKVACQRPRSLPQLPRQCGLLDYKRGF